MLLEEWPIWSTLHFNLSCLIFFGRLNLLLDGLLEVLADVEI
jgi:hypothetical protein